MNNCIFLLSQVHICQLLYENGAEKSELAKLLSMCRQMLAARKSLFFDSFTLRLSSSKEYCDALKMGAKRVILQGEWVAEYNFDFENAENALVRFECSHAEFNQKISSFGRLKYFRALDFNQPITSFGMLEHFVSRDFNQTIASFGNLKYFEANNFNQPIESFGNLIFFSSMVFNHPIKSFEALDYFSSDEFDQPIKSFGALEYFSSDTFNRPIASFDRLVYFYCSSFNQHIDSLNSLRHLHCASIRQRKPLSFGQLLSFWSEKGVQINRYV